MSSFVSPGTGGSIFSALGVAGTGVVLSMAATGSLSPSTAKGVSARFMFAIDGEEGRERGRAAFKVAGKGGAFGGVRRSMT